MARKKKEAADAPARIGIRGLDGRLNCLYGIPGHSAYFFDPAAPAAAAPSARPVERPGGHAATGERDRKA